MDCGRSGPLAAGAPFGSGNFPHFGGQAAGDVVAFGDGYDAHALLFGDAARGDVRNRFGGAENGKLEHVEPEGSDGIGGFGHQSAAMKGGIKPEATIVVVVGFMEIDAADDSSGIGLEADAPIPCLAASHGGKRAVAEEGQGAVRRIGPGNARCEMPDDFPLREDELDLRRVRKFERLKQETRGLERRGH